MHKNHLQFLQFPSKEKTQTAQQKNIKDLDRQFTKEDVQMANKYYVKALRHTNEIMQVKTTVQLHTHQIT